MNVLYSLRKNLGQLIPHGWNKILICVHASIERNVQFSKQDLRGNSFYTYVHMAVIVLNGRIFCRLFLRFVSYAQMLGQSIDGFT